MVLIGIDRHKATHTAVAVDNEETADYENSNDSYWLANPSTPFPAYSRSSVPSTPPKG